MNTGICWVTGVWNKILQKNNWFNLSNAIFFKIWFFEQFFKNIQFYLNNYFTKNTGICCVTLILFQNLCIQKQLIYMCTNLIPWTRVFVGWRGWGPRVSCLGRWCSIWGPRPSNTSDPCPTISPVSTPWKSNIIYI